MNYDELPQHTLRELLARARGASEVAYSPYSRFRVGAAVLTPENAIYSGCNVENASYGLTCCAERNAVFQMVARGERGIAAIVIYTPTPEPSAPCGACRQVLNEFSPDALVYGFCDGERVLIRRVRELLPDAFATGALEHSLGPLPRQR